MQTVCRRIKANIKGDGFSAQQVPDFLFMSRLRQIAPLLQYVIDVGMIVASITHPNPSKCIMAFIVPSDPENSKGPQHPRNTNADPLRFRKPEPGINKITNQ